MKTAVFIYEAIQVELLKELLPIVPGDERIVIACSAEVEFSLEKENIPFRSARNFRPTSAYERLIFSEKTGQSIFTDPALSFFSYKGVNLGKLYVVAFQYYLAGFIYYVDIVSAALSETTYDRIVTFASSIVESPTGGILHALDVRIVVDAITLVSRQKKLECEVAGTFLRKPVQALQFKRILFGLGREVVNFLTTLLVPKKRVRILASEQWKNISSLMNEFPESELVLLDRAESLKAGRAAIFRNRMQFMHSADFVNARTRHAAEKHSREFEDFWNEIADEVTPLNEAVFGECMLTPHLKNVVQRIISLGGFRAVCDIDGTYAMYEKTKPDVVIVRAGVSAQIHFAILCEVARAFHVPSLEIQHGAFYFGQESFSRNRAAEYIAEYGPLVRRQLHTIGYDDEHLFDIGSPRFDAYKAAQTQKSKRDAAVFNIVFVPIDAMPGFWTDSYDVLDYFQSMADAVRSIPNAHVAVRLRPGPQFAAFYKEVLERTFKDISYRIAQNDPLVELLPNADVVVSCYSTVLTEALLSDVPVIYDAAQTMHDTLSAEYQVYEDAHAVRIVRTSDELARALHEVQIPEEREKLIRGAQSFMREQYSFDGHASRRLAEVVIDLAARKH